MVLIHTGLTEEVLNYKAPHPWVKEFEPPKDRAFFADPTKKSLLEAASKVKKLTPYIGTELEGIQLSQLTDAQKDELALLAAERGVVFFRDQDITIDQQYELTKYYGLQDRDPNQVDARHVTILGRDEYGFLLLLIYQCALMVILVTYVALLIMVATTTPIIPSKQIRQRTQCYVYLRPLKQAAIPSGLVKPRCTTSSHRTFKSYSRSCKACIHLSTVM